MSSLLEGIDVGESGGSKSKSSGGPNPKVIKGAIAGALFLLAAVVLGMQFNVIPSPFGGGSVKNNDGDVVTYVAPSEEEVRETKARLDREEAEFIKRGGVVGGS